MVEGSAPAEVVEGQIPATACPSPAPIAAGEQQPVAAAGAPPALLLILDSSGSMQEDDGSGRRKIDAAKEALNTLVDSLPDGAPVGLRVYGHRVPNTDKANGCNDTELIAPIGPLDKAVMKERIASFQAVGFTPIATSLQAAAKDLPPEGERTVVLVSDGEETCDRDPCQVARDLDAQGINLAVETVGFQVDETTRTQLECIAEATGGQYHDASDAAQLAATLQQISSRALRTYQATGTAVKGGDSPQNATLLGPGQYTDTIATGRTLHYAVQMQAGQRLDFTVTLLSQPDINITDVPGAGTVIRLISPSGQPLESGSGGLGVDNESVVVRSGPVAEAGLYRVEYSARGDISDDLTSRLFETEILVRIDGQSCTAIPAAVAPGAIQGSGDFNTAPGVTSGTYQDTFQINEAVYYAVLLDEGQGIRATATLEDRTEIDPLEFVGAGLELRLLSPVRDAVKETFTSVAFEDVKQVALDFPAVSEAGLYHIEVKLEQYTGRLQGLDFKFDLAVEIID